jgi:diphosphomevalonate decarboxylase
MSTFTSKAIASPNIAFIKYWGNKDPELRIPANRSLSMTLGGLETETSVTLLEHGSDDKFILNGDDQTGDALVRVSRFLSNVRSLADRLEPAQVVSSNNFPSGAGIASSAAAFSALALAASTAYSLQLTPTELSMLARRGSGSAARSVFSGFVEMNTGSSDTEAFADTFLPGDYWQLHDWIAVVDSSHKMTGSTDGHAIADTSPLQPARVEDTDRRMEICKRALKERDFNTFAEIVEQDSNLMHAVMITSTPSLFYIQPASLMVMRNVRDWRHNGLNACYTVDAGPNVHVICTPEHAEEVERRLRSLEPVKSLIHAVPGTGVRLIDGISV